MKKLSHTYADVDVFIGELHGYCREEKNLAERFRTLCFMRSELAGSRQGKK